MTSRILVVDDDVLIAFDIADQLADAGFDVVGPATSVAAALKLVSSLGCDAAVIDVNLGAETSEAIARTLQSLGTPYVVVTGYSDDQLPQPFAGARVLGKPVRAAHLLDAVRGCLDNGLTD